MADWSEGMLNLAIQPLKLSYLNYYNAYGHHIWQGDD